jgi:hypothetical protein
MWLPHTRGDRPFDTDAALSWSMAPPHPLEVPGNLPATYRSGPEKHSFKRLTSANDGNEKHHYITTGSYLSLSLVGADHGQNVVDGSPTPVGIDPGQS